jgi:signal peptidase II
VRVVQDFDLPSATDIAAATDRRPGARALVPLVVALGFGTVLDQLAKHWAELHLRPRGIVTLVPELFDLRYVRNPGAFFSLGAELAPDLRRALLCAASVLVLALIAGLYVRTRAEDARTRWGLALLGAGAIGNLIDRARQGEVVDFLHLHYGAVLRWATFNVADVAITLGLCLLAWDLLRPRVAPALPSQPAPNPAARTATDGGT